MNIQLWNEDCIQGMRDRLAPESVDLTVTSIPFASLFQYSGKTEDVGNSADAGLNFVGSVFGLHMRFFIEQLFRVHKPGTLVCIHVQQLITYKIQHGYAGRRDFRGAVIDLFMAGGFDWQSEVAIPKNPQAIAQRQKLNSLLFVTGKRDARQLSPAVNDYLLVFKKPGQAVPVPALADSRYESEEDTDYGDRNVMPLPATGAPHGWVSSNDWIKWAHGCWTDIQETDVLDGYRSAREKDDERHVCPLQLEVIRRCIRLYSNPGEVVLDPFVGIGSTCWVAEEQGRNAVGFELKESYYQQALANIEKIQHRGDSATMDIFAVLDSLPETVEAAG